MPTACTALLAAHAELAAALAAQAPLPVDALVAAVRPALPFPAASSDGTEPATHDADPAWFVVWPTPGGEARIVVRANPLNPAVQRAAADAMRRINDAVAHAERRAQAAYEKALEDVRRGGGAADIDGITLDDEGVEGDRLDAELELVIEAHPAESTTVASADAPEVAAGPPGVAWVVRIPAHVYSGDASGTGDRFRPAEARVYVGAVQQPRLTRRGTSPVMDLIIDAADEAAVVVLRGNAALIEQVVSGADWRRLSSH